MLNMDVNQIQLLDIGLNVLGFVAGGGMLMLMSSIFRREKRVNAQIANAITTPNEKTTAIVEPDIASKGFQFIDLTGSNSNETPSVTAAPGPTLMRRNRTEVFEMAQRMLRERRSDKDISDELNMSQAEISLLKAQSVKDKGVKHV